MLVGFHTIGGQGGAWVELVGGYDGSTLKQIKVWVGGWQLRGVWIKLTNGREAMFGKQDGPMKEYTFRAGERMTRLSLWGNGAGTRTGWIEFDTSTGGHFSHGMNEWGRKTEYKMDIGSGICVGAYGHAGLDVDALGFAFIQPLRSSRLVDVTFPAHAVAQVSFPPKTLVSQTLNNNSSVEQSTKMTVSYTDASRDVFSTEGTLEVSFEAANETTVEFSFPELGKASNKTTMKFGTKMSAKVARTWESSQSETRSHEFPVRVPPRMRVTVDAWIYSGSFDLDFTGSLELVTTSGARAKIPISGKYSGVTTSQVYTNVAETPSELIAAAAAAPHSAIASSAGDAELPVGELTAADLTEETAYPSITADEARLGRAQPQAVPSA